MSPLSLDLRTRIVKSYETGRTSIRKLAEQFQVSKATVHKLILLKRETGQVAPKPARGGKPSPLVGKEAEARAMVAEHPDYTLSEYCEVWLERTGMDISQSTMCRFLQRLNLTRKKKQNATSSFKRKPSNSSGKPIGHASPKNRSKI